MLQKETSMLSQPPHVSSHGMHVSIHHHLEHAKDMRYSESSCATSAGRSSSATSTGSADPGSECRTGNSDGHRSSWRRWLPCKRRAPKLREAGAGTPLRAILPSTNTALSPRSATATAKTKASSCTYWWIRSSTIQTSSPDPKASKSSSTNQKEQRLIASFPISFPKPPQASWHNDQILHRTDPSSACRPMNIKPRRLDFSSTNEQGQSILLTAVTDGDVDRVRAMLQRGANVFVQDHQGRTACDLASKPEMKALLMKSKAEMEHTNLTSFEEMEPVSSPLTRSRRSIDLSWARVSEECDLDSLLECLSARR
eukprot:gb/GEZN01009307.1/.p1 GENE.gb/GEZN01009307.1/~~gb/GEZN01009307.1/.p1  ORF type:complete len:312 (-),score=1.82 gb/GEZN01009307.1/:231-1166(-)